MVNSIKRILCIKCFVEDYVITYWKKIENVFASFTKYFITSYCRYLLILIIESHIVASEDEI